MILLTISLWNTIQCYFFEKFDTVQCVENCVCLCDCMFVCICLCELMLMSVCVGNGMSAHFSCMCNYVFLYVCVSFMSTCVLCAYVMSSDT